MLLSEGSINSFRNCGINFYLIKVNRQQKGRTDFFKSKDLNQIVLKSPHMCKKA